MTVGVYGLGRFGSFWAGLLSGFCEVWASSRDPARQTPDGVKRVAAGELFRLDAVFICVAISAVEQVLAEMAGGVSDGALIMDTCSVKTYPMDMMNTLLPKSVSILGTHPMFGPDSARGGVRGLPMILCPGRIPDAELSTWKSFFSSMGLAVHIMEAAEHDREAAFTQGIAHYIGRVLEDFGVRESKIATMGYGKLLEIVEQTCNDPWQLFLDLQRYNPYTREMRAKLKKSLDAVMSAIET
jgi:prephenate dehydrogenase